MPARSKLERLFAVVIAEAARNSDFAERLEKAIGGASPGGAVTKPGKGGPVRRGGRRAPAVLDPVALAHEGERQLREALGQLDLQKLHDIVAEYGMDPGKLVMKWKDKERVIDRIVEIALARSTKGDAFRLS